MTSQQPASIPTVTVQGTTCPPEPIEKNTFTPLMSRTRKPVQRILKEFAHPHRRIYRVNTKDGYGYSSPGSFFELFLRAHRRSCESLPAPLRSLRAPTPTTSSLMPEMLRAAVKTLADHLA